jgi:hypothetical protein
MDDVGPFSVEAGQILVRTFAYAVHQPQKDLAWGIDGRFPSKRLGPVTAILAMSNLMPETEVSEGAAEVSG